MDEAATVPSNGMFFGHELGARKKHDIPTKGHGQRMQVIANCDFLSRFLLLVVFSMKILENINFVMGFGRTSRQKLAEKALGRIVNQTSAQSESVRCAAGHKQNGLWPNVTKHTFQDHFVFC